MEKEIKLVFENKGSFSALREKLSEKTKAEEIKMKAVYYDAFDDSLRNSGSALRVRHENDEIVLTVKSGGGSNAGMHERKEWNVKLDSEKIDFDSIDKSKIETTDSIAEFFEIVGSVKNKGLKEICRTVFVRSSFEITDGESVAEICLDEGEIISGEKSEPISELEIELHSGSESYIEKIAAEISKNYSLKAEDRSKFARGLALYLSN